MNKKKGQLKEEAALKLKLCFGLLSKGKKHETRNDWIRTHGCQYGATTYERRPPVRRV
jgi:hypothetical protein